MTYQVFNNSGPADAIYQFSLLPTAAKVSSREAHTSIWRYVTANRPPFALTGLLVGDGAIFDDPLPGPDYVGSLDGTWIWSSPAVYFRIRLIRTKSKLDLWEQGVGPSPHGVTLVPVTPIGRLAVARR